MPILLALSDIDLAADENGIAVSVHDAGSGGGVGIHEVASCVGGIIGAFGIAVTQRILDNGESRDGLAVALELRLALMIGGFDGSLDLLDGDGIALGDDEGNAELGRTTVDMPILRWQTACSGQEIIHRFCTG